MANISTENINTLAQVAASVKDGDYIYIYKAASGEFSRVELSVFLQQMSAGGSGGGVASDDVKTNVELIRTKVNELIGKLANVAFNIGQNELPPLPIDELHWSDDSQGSNTPVLTSPSNGSTVNVGMIASGGTSVSKTITVKGLFLNQSLSVSVIGNGFSVQPTSIPALNANNGTTLTITYSSSVDGDASGSVVISSSEVRASLIVTASKASSSVTTYSVSAGTLQHCSIANLPTNVEEGGIWSGTLDVDASYSRPDDIVVNGSHGTVNYNQNTGEIRIYDIVSDISISATAVEDAEQDTGYVSNGLVMHLDGLNQGSQSEKWIDTVGGKEFAFSSSGATAVANGVQFDGARTSYAACESLVNVPYNQGTIEVCFTQLDGFVDASQVFLVQSENNLLCSGIQRFSAAAASPGVHAVTFGTFNTEGQTLMARRKAASNGTDSAAIISQASTISQSVDRMMINGNVCGLAIDGTRFLFNTNNVGIRIGSQYSTITGSAGYGCKAIIHDIRIYNRLLTEEEMRYNQRIDNERYNLGLTL